VVKEEIPDKSRFSRASATNKDAYGVFWSIDHTELFQL